MNLCEVNKKVKKNFIVKIKKQFRKLNIIYSKKIINENIFKIKD